MSGANRKIRRFFPQIKGFCGSPSELEDCTYRDEVS
jgi:hypothetical protein